MPAVRVFAGLIISLVSAASAITVRSFLGQRYALAPVGPRRFKPAVLAPFDEASMTGDGDELGTLGPRCTQSDGSRSDISEDCLFLNIYAPKNSFPLAAGGDGQAPAAVFLWIHGGGWDEGSGNEYNGTALAASQGIVVVSINYRLGTLGFFASEELEKEEGNNGATGGMNGLLDMITAMRWVQANIHQFGGNPDQVTIAGESAGAEAVCNLLVSPVASRLFSRAIIESGPCLGGWYGWGAMPRDRVMAGSAALANGRTLAELRAVEDAYELLQTDHSQGKIEDSVDGYVLPGSRKSMLDSSPAFQLFSEGKLNSREVMIGGNSFDGLHSYYVPYYKNIFTGMLSETTYNSEMSKDWGVNTDEVKALYPSSRFDDNTNAAWCKPNGDAGVVCPSFEVARGLVEANATAFVFYFDYGPVCGDEAVGFKAVPGWASHASEIAWVWGDSPACYRNSTELALLRTTQDLWGSFCRTGKPSSGSLTWTPFDPQRGNSMILDLEPRMVDGVKAADCAALHAINQSFWPAKKSTAVVTALV